MKKITKNKECKVKRPCRNRPRCKHIKMLVKRSVSFVKDRETGLFTNIFNAVFLCTVVFSCIAFFHCGLFPLWSFSIVVFFHCGLFPLWSFSIVVFFNCGLFHDGSNKRPFLAQGLQSFPQNIQNKFEGTYYSILKFEMIKRFITGQKRTRSPSLGQEPKGTQSQ